jgi:DNA-binding NarL/FixJ family response regulator
MVAPREGKQAPSGGAGVVLIRMLTVDEHPDIHSSLAILASLDPAFGLVTRPLSKKPSVFDSVRDLRVQFPDVRCVFLTSDPHRSNLAAAYTCGASGFFAKGDDLNEIVDGLKVISSCGQSAFIVGKKAIEHFRTAVGKSEPS